MVEQFLENHWLILVSIPVIAVAVGSILLLLGTYNRYTKISNEIRNKFLSDLEKEKRQISRELHDSISSFTILLKDYFSNNKSVDKEDKAEWAKKISDLETFMANLNEEIYPPEFLEGNLFTAIESYTNNYKYSDLKISLWINDKPKIHRRYQIQVYRIIQESIVNIAKHTDSKHLSIYIDQNKSVLKIVLNYSFTDLVKTTIYSGKRGKKIIDERMRMVNGKKKLIRNNELLSEVFTFNIVE